MYNSNKSKNIYNKNYLLRFPLGFKLFYLFNFVLQQGKSYSQFFHTKNIPFQRQLRFVLCFLFVISYHRQHHRFTLCRQCLVCILMSNTHRAEAVIKNRNKQLLFLYSVWFQKERTLHKRRENASVLHKKNSKVMVITLLTLPYLHLFQNFFL